MSGFSVGRRADGASDDDRTENSMIDSDTEFFVSNSMATEHVSMVTRRI